MAYGERLAELRANGKFVDPDFARDGSPRAHAPFIALDTLWVNTGTLCNIECRNCYIESSPVNDRLAYLTADEFAPFLAQAVAMGAREVGFTGGEPFMNPHLPLMARAALEAGLSVLILTNAMRPAMRPAARKETRALTGDFGARLRLRVSLDDYRAAGHDAERGSGSFAAALSGLTTLATDGAALSVAGRLKCSESEDEARRGYQALFRENNLEIDAFSGDQLVLFPEMNDGADTPEITTGCWTILGKSPNDLMCANSRMLIKRKGAAPSIVACTLIVDDAQFELGASLEEAARPVALNHPHCSRFCVLGGARCST